MGRERGLCGLCGPGFVALSGQGVGVHLQRGAGFPQRIEFTATVHGQHIDVGHVHHVRAADGGGVAHRAAKAAVEEAASRALFSRLRRAQHAAVVAHFTVFKAQCLQHAVAVKPVRQAAVAAGEAGGAIAVQRAA